jgi:hypothetical protein
VAAGVASVAEEGATEDAGAGDGKTTAEEVCEVEVAEGCGENALCAVEVGGSEPVVSNAVGAGEGVAGALVTTAYESVTCWDSMGAQTRIVNR